MATQYVAHSGGDFTSMAALLAAMPSVLTEPYICRIRNDGEYTTGFEVTGKTTTTINRITIECDTGHSWKNHANVRTNPYVYDVSKGVGFSANDFLAAVILINNDWVIVDGLQAKRSGNSYSKVTCEFGAGTGNSWLLNSIIAKTQSGASGIAIMDAATAINTLFYNQHATVGLGVSFQGGGTGLNLTIVNGAAAGGTAITTAYGSPTISNTAVFGFTTVSSGGALLGNYNCTDGASIVGANSQANLTYADQFENIANDWRVKTGADLISAGNTDATNAPNDATGFVRGVGTLGDCGAWEHGAAIVTGTVNGVNDVETVPQAQATGGVNSVTIQLKSDPTTFLASTALRFWTRNTIDGAVVDGGSGGLAFSTDPSGSVTVTGLLIATGARILTVQDPANALNSHNYPVTIV